MSDWIATIGYEKANIDDFVETLRAAGVEVLVDVRAVTHSRRRDFSGRILAAHLSGAGVGYVHLPGLGTPKAGREAARSGRRDRFREIMAEHLDSRPAQADMERLEDISRENAACLMCLEADYRQCHRAMVADLLVRRRPLQVRHLKVGGGGQAELFAASE